MTKTGKSKPCLPCQQKNRTPAEKLQQIIDTRSTVCFQSLNEFAGYAFVGVFAGMHKGVDRWMRRFGTSHIMATSHGAVPRMIFHGDQSYVLSGWGCNSEADSRISTGWIQ